MSPAIYRFMMFLCKFAAFHALQSHSTGIRYGVYLIGSVSALWMISCEIIEPDISKDQVRIIAPSNHAEIESGMIQFRWDAVPGALGYEFSILRASAGGRYLVADTTIFADTLDRRRYGYETELHPGEYEWTVAAFNSNYSTSAEVRHLVVLAEEKGDSN